MSFKDAEIPIESQLMLDYANGMPFKEVLAKYRLHLAANLFVKTLLQDDCACVQLLKDL